jgi:Histidine kinase
LAPWSLGGINFSALKMKCKNHTVRYHLTETVALFIFGGLVTGFLTCRSCFADLSIVWRVWIFNGLMWVLLWKGNEYITCIIDDRISWLKEPLKRFLVGVCAMLVYTITAVIANTYLFVYYLKSDNMSMTFQGSILYVIASSIGITVFIMLFFLSRSFLLSWRQSAINEEKLRKENIISQYEALKNQVNPHFLFNTLNALSSLIYEDQDKAIQFINKFSDVYRYVLDSKDKEVVPVGNEIGFVKSYLYLLHSRYEKNLEINLDENITDGYVPPMAIQLLVENAVKHNVIADDSRIRIRIRLDKNYIVVENNINPKVNSANATGTGLENIKSRYSILSDTPVIIKNDGSIFSVSVPVLQMQEK